MSQWSIGQIAKRAGVGIDTLRYYEREGLLSPTGRLASGYRRYGESELKRLRFIRRAKALGFSLDDIRSLLALSGTDDIAEVRQSAQSKLVDVQQRIDELVRMRDGLQRLISACPGHGLRADCPILHALSQEDES